ncbi:MAG: YbhB/YbcL family Raf kinase inhibitor-like protein [Actinomycetes bacterium]
MTIDRLVTVNPYDYLPPVPELFVSSPDITDGAALGLAFVNSMAGGGNESPALAWSGAPEATLSYAVTCFDPDAPTPSGFWHWLVVDIPAAVPGLARGAGASDATLPGGFHIRHDLGACDYAGAAPPKGDRVHRYMFVVHAVDVPTLGVDQTASPAMVSFNLAFHTLARGIITATYQN